MPTILLIRHAENEYVAKGRLAGRLPGVHLNEKGRQQAKALARALAKVPLKAIYSSPLERCLETAQPLAAAHNLDVIPRQGLIEIDFGNWQGKTLKQLRRRRLWPVVQHNPARLTFPEGESFAAAQLRLVDEIERLVAEHKPKDLIACFSHSDCIRLLLAYYLGVPLDLFQRLAISPASVSSLMFGERAVRILGVNQQIDLPFKK